MRGTPLLGPLAAAVVAATSAWYEPDHPGLQAASAPVWADDASCRICHPGPTKGLRRSAHAQLLEQPAGACTACHGDLSAHAGAAAAGESASVAVPPVLAAACAACHEGGLVTADGAHPWRPDGAAAQEPPPAVLPMAAEGARILGLDWSALLAGGYRFVSRAGSRERYETDLNLDRGFRLLEAELEGRGAAGSGYADLVRVRAEDVDDPYMRVDGVVESTGLYRAEAGYRRATVKYRAAGDYHRVDQRRQDADYALTLQASDDVEVFARFRRSHDTGFWLTNRVGNLNVTPQTTVAGVESPRELDADDVEAGITAELGGFAVTATVEYRDEQTRDQWLYQRTAPANPLFTESEDFLSAATLRGPGARLALSRAFDGLTLDLTGRVLDLERRVVGDGQETGFDIGAFTSTTAAFAEGHARTWLLDGTATMELSDAVALVLDLRWVDHEEELDIDQVETKVYPGLGTTAVAATNLRQRTAQRQFEGSVAVDAEPVDGIVLTAGYGWSREWLSVPDLEAGDGDFRRGLIQNDGVLLGAAWRPDDHWVLRADHREFGQNGVQLHDIVEDRARRSAADLRYRTETWSLGGFGRYRLRENDVSETRAETGSAGLSATAHRGEALDLFASYTWSDVDARTLTNFYFDPDPNPVPTFVRYDGVSHSLALGLTARPGAKVRWRLDGSVTDTDGSFDLRFWDLRSDLAVRVLPGGDAGVLLRYVDYDDALGQSDEYDALLTTVYWRQSFGRR